MEELQQRMEEAAKYICGDDDVWADKITSFGKVAVLKESDECTRGTYIKQVLEDYANREGDRPFCISVFGPPGSGKSTLVKAIIEDLSLYYSDIIEVNMTEVGEGDGYYIDFRLDGKIPVIFFDEFDSSIGRNPVAWLQKFLPVMQDGHIRTRAGMKPIKRALLIFAGGTADTLDDFVEHHRKEIESYKALKVPDFISRLHPYLNISGINGDPIDRLMRRALALRYQLSKRGMSTVDVDLGLLSELLTNTHFIHNQRSLQSVIDMCLLSKKARFDKGCLPGADDNERRLLLQAHVSRGPFDKCSICLSTWQGDSDVHTFALELSERLLSEGATIAFGGDLEIATGGGHGMLLKLIDKASAHPEGLIKRGEEPAIINYLAYPSNLREEVKVAIEAVEKASSTLVQFIKDPTLSGYELDHFSLPDDYFQSTDSVDAHVAWAISLFRMRLRMIQDIEGLVVFGGKGEEDGRSSTPKKPVWGRCSGIAEEIFLALNYRKPVYIIRNGAGALVGQLLGLGPRRWTKPLVSETEPGFEERLTEFKECFNLPGRDESVVTQEELLAELAKFSIDGPKWVYNGLSRDENIALFNLRPFDPDTDIANDHIDRAIRLISKGLKKVIQPRLT